MNDKLIPDFVAAIRIVESELFALHLELMSFEKKGLAYFANYCRGNIVVQFLYGPSDWDIEMIVTTPKGRFEFKDLRNMPVIAEWVDQNRYVPQSKRDIESEL